MKIHLRFLSQTLEARTTYQLFPTPPTPPTCPTSPTLENAFYPNVNEIAINAVKLIEPTNSWQPKLEDCEMAYQKEFKGPF